jgi:hypothetical protein
VTTEQLLDASQRRPFVPFVIRQADGNKTRVTHPEAVADGGGRIVVYIHPNGRVETIDLLLVPKLLIEEPPAPKRRKGSE